MNWEAFLYDTKRTSFLWTVITHTRGQALHAGLEWMIIAKQNRKPTTLLVADDVGNRLLEAATNARKLKHHSFHSRAVRMFNFEDVLRYVDPEELLQLTENRHEV